MDESPKHKIKTVEDIASLSALERGRLIPDLLSWCNARDFLKASGAPFATDGFTWVDDGNQGTISAIIIHDDKGVEILKIDLA